MSDDDDRFSVAVKLQVAACGAASQVTVHQGLECLRRDASTLAGSIVIYGQGDRSIIARFYRGRLVKLNHIFD